MRHNSRHVIRRRRRRGNRQQRGRQRRRRGSRRRRRGRQTGRRRLVMLHQQRLVGELFGTSRARVMLLLLLLVGRRGRLTGVRLHVRAQVGAVGEGFPAMRAAVRFFARVRPQMTLQ